MRNVAPFPFPPGWKPKAPPVKYYGGKQRLWNHIIPLVPNHQTRKEPFLGGCTSLALPPSTIEIWNDRNPFVVNFYEVAQLWKEELIKKIQTCLNSEHQYRRAHQLYRECQEPSKLTKTKRIEMAWAFFILCNLSFAGDFSGGYQVSYTERIKNRIQGKKKRIDAFCRRIEEAQLLCRNALDVITAGNNESVWAYIDPPYIEAKQGHYKGYTLKNFNQLLDALSNMKGLFLLSSYPNDILLKYTKKNKWNHKEVAINCDANNGKKRKLECLTWNYDIEKKIQQASLF